MALLVKSGLTFTEKRVGEKQKSNSYCGTF